MLSIETLAGINFVAIVVCTLLAMALGMLWYSMFLFGKPWLEGVGLTPDDTKSDKALIGMVVSLMTTIVETFVLALAVAVVSAEGAGQGAAVGALLSIGVVTPMLLSNSLFEQRPVEVWAINAGYRVTYFVVNGAILGAWR